MGERLDAWWFNQAYKQTIVWRIRNGPYAMSCSGSRWISRVRCGLKNVRSLRHDAASAPITLGMAMRLRRKANKIVDTMPWPIRVIDRIKHSRRYPVYG